MKTLNQKSKLLCPVGKHMSINNPRHIFTTFVFAIVGFLLVLITGVGIMSSQGYAVEDADEASDKTENFTYSLNKYQVTVDLNGGEIKDAGSPPSGWKETTNNKFVKEFEEFTTYKTIMGEWANTEIEKMTFPLLAGIQLPPTKN